MIACLRSADWSTNTSADRRRRPRRGEELLTGDDQVNDFAQQVLARLRKSEFNLGIPTVDSEHEWFFEIINHLYAAMSAGAPAAEMNAIADELVAFASTHFAHEEKVLAEMKYPGIGIHRKQHDYFMRELGNLPIASSSCDALAVLKNWMLNHILGTDRQCLAWITARAERPRAVS